MVTLSTAYGLCSLIEQNGFLHVSDDCEGCACVTLGKNIAIRYRLVDQKQLNSWSTIAPFTSPVIYNAANAEYIAIFNENIVKKWKIEDTNLDKVHKIKLKDAGHCVLLREQPVVVFKSGACCTLSYVEEKSQPIKGFLTEQDKIIATRIIAFEELKYLVVVVSTGVKNYTCYCVKLTGDSFLPDLTSLKTLRLRRRGHNVMSCCFVTRESGDYLATLWSDNFIYLLPLPWTSADESTLGIFSGVVRSVSAKTPAVMTGLSSNHIALYGGDPAEEGAVLAVYNVDFGMVQASTTFKLLHKPPRLWAVHDRLLLGFGQRLLCVPFTLQTDSVAALVGSRPLAKESKTCDVMSVVPSVAWEKDEQPKSMPQKDARDVKDVKSEIELLASQGFSESGICETIITQYLEKQDVKTLCWCVDNFADIPERLTVRLLHSAFAFSDDKFSEVDISSPAAELPVVNGGSPKKPKKKRKSAKMNHVNGVNGVCSEPAVLTEPLLFLETTEACPVSPAARAAFLDRVLRVPSNKGALVPALRTGLTTTDCINVLQYLSYLLTSDARGLGPATIDWITTITDAFYQQLLLGRHSECVEVVFKLKEQVAQQISAVNELKDLLPKVVRLKNKQQLARNPLQMKSYSIQTIQIYQ